jgi:hypothetical protein
MIKITLPDNSVKEFDKGITGLEIAEAISSRLAKEVLSIVVNGEVRDLTRTIDSDASYQTSLVGRLAGARNFLAFVGTSDGRGHRIFLSGNQIWNWSDR